MTDTSVTPSDVFLFDRARLSQRHSTWTVAGAGAVTLGVLVGSWLIDHRLSDPPTAALDAGTARLTAAFHTPPAATLPDLALPAPRGDEPARPAAVAVTTAPTIPPLALEPPKVEAALLDPASVNGRVPLALADSAPLPPRFVAPTPGATEPAAPTPGPAIALLVPLPETPHDTAPLPDAPVPPPAEAIPAAATVTAAPQAAAAPQQAAAVPLPAPRPDFRFATPEPSPRAPRRQMARNTDTAPAPVAPGIPADNRSFLDKFFGALKPSNGPTLAYASPEDGLFGRSTAAPSGAAYSRAPYTAVYDISAHTVFMPDGSKLEAHSGLGRMLDDPRHVAARNVGPTPPHLYDLTLRESLFHGVQALRLTPVGGGGVYGRDGLLAHTFMLGPNGDSNGCVSFRDYAAFLRAYQSGQVKRLVVVAGG